MPQPVIASSEEIRRCVNHFQPVISEIPHMFGISWRKKVCLAGCRGRVSFQILEHFCQMLSPPEVFTGQKRVDFEQPRICPSVHVNDSLICSFAQNIK